MKRSALTRKTPMKSAAFARVAAKEAGAVTKLRKTLTSSRPKMTPIRRAARGQECTLMIPFVCNRNPETTVLCNSNSLADGKGMGLKAPDEKAAFGCAACHDVLDGRRARPDGVTVDGLDRIFRAGIARTHITLAAMGVIEDGTGSTAIDPAPEHLSLEQ